MSVTPVAAPVTLIPLGGGPVVCIPANPNGGFIVNPLTAEDEGLPVTEPLYVDPVGDAALQAGGTTFALAPGQKWDVIPGQTTPTSINAASPGHKFSAVFW